MGDIKLEINTEEEERFVLSKISEEKLDNYRNGYMLYIENPDKTFKIFAFKYYSHLRPKAIEAKRKGLKIIIACVPPERNWDDIEVRKKHFENLIKHSGDIDLHL